MIRLVLAATLGASYGIYGPAFELLRERAARPGSEEYLDSEKYQLRHWDLGAAGQPAPSSSPASTGSAATTRRCSATGLRFHPVDNEQLSATAKTADGSTT
jgi:starch synthase (maltosyl-transferring)